MLLDRAGHDTVMTEALLVSIAQMMSNKHPGIIAAVKEDIGGLLKAPGAFILGEKADGYAESLAEWRKKPPYEAFDLRTLRHVPLDFPFLWLIGHLRKIDITAYLSWLDCLQNPNLIEDAFQAFEILQDFDEIIRLLESAPPAYEEGKSSHWVSLIAPILLETALGHVQTLLVPFARPERDQEVYKKLHDDLSHRMERRARVLANRPDGSEITAHWLLRLVRMKTQLEPWRTLPASIAIGALVKVFGDSEAHAAAVVQFIPPAPTLLPDEEENLRQSGVGQPPARLTPGTDFLIARLLMKAFRQDTESFQSELHEFSALLLARDPGLSKSPANIEMATWRHRLVGCTLLGPGIVSSWLRLWGQMEEQRRRRRHIAFTSDHSSDEPSLFLCSTALSLLEEKGYDRQLKAPAALELWDAVYESVWFMTLIHGFQVGGDVWRCLLTLLLGALPRHCDLASEHGIDRLSGLLSSFACDEELIAHSVARLFREGVSPLLLVGALTRAGVQLESMLAWLDQFPDDVSMYPLNRYHADAVSICREVLKLSNPE